MDTPPTSHPSDRLPSWLAEALDVLSARRRIVVATAVGLVLLGAIVALVAPSILPARAVVGAAVGIAAALLATALALAMDASDLVVRGVRHVRAAGGTVDVHVGRQHDDVGPLLAAVARHASDGQVRVALSSASRTAGVPGVRAAALAEALARTGRKVLLTDLARGGTPAAGLSDVISGSRSLPEVVRFEQELYLARLAVGSDPDAAIRGFAGWVEGLPSDLEVLVAALPPLADPGVLAAAGAMDVTLVLVEVDRTERVDLIASLDAVDASGLTSELVLVDPERTPAADAPVADDEADAAPDEPEDEAVATRGEPEDAAGPSIPATEGEQVEPAEAIDEPPLEEPEPVGAEDDVLAAIGLDDPDERADADDARDGGAGEVAGLLGGVPVTPPGAATPPVPSGDEGASHEVAEPSDDERASEAAGPADADATAEIPLTPSPTSDDDLSHIWDPPSPTTTSDEPDAEAVAEPVPSAAPEPSQEAAHEAAHDPGPAWDQESTDEPEPSGVPDAAAPPDASTTPEETGSSHEPSPAVPAAAEPGPVADDAPDVPPATDPGQRPVPAAARGGEQRELSVDPAAMEVARTSAALHQLAQQIWERDDR